MNAESTPHVSLDQHINDRFHSILGQFGASDNFVGQALRQYHVALQVSDPDGVATDDVKTALANDVLNGMINEFSVSRAARIRSLPPAPSSSRTVRRRWRRRQPRRRGCSR